MAIRVSAVSQKGGTTKSTLIEALHVNYSAAGWDVAGCDFDTQQATYLEFSQARVSNGFGQLDVAQYTDVAKALRETAERDLVLLDGLPHGSQLALDIALASDLVIIPTGPARADMKPSVILAHRLVQAGLPADRIAFAIGRTSSTGAEEVEARAYLAETGYFTAPGFLRTMKTYSDASDIGLAVTEVRPAKLRQQANELIGGLIARIEQLT